MHLKEGARTCFILSGLANPHPDSETFAVGWSGAPSILPVYAQWTKRDDASHYVPATPEQYMGDIRFRDLSRWRKPCGHLFDELKEHDAVFVAQEPNVQPLKELIASAPAKPNVISTLLLTNPETLRLRRMNHINQAPFEAQMDTYDYVIVDGKVSTCVPDSRTQERMHRIILDHILEDTTPKEMLVELDEAGNVRGPLVRKVAHDIHGPLPIHLCVTVKIRAPDHEVFLGQRNGFKPENPFLWQVPSGHVNYKDILRARGNVLRACRLGARREVNEEAGLMAPINSFKFIPNPDHPLGLWPVFSKRQRELFAFFQYDIDSFNKDYLWPCPEFRNAQWMHEDKVLRAIRKEPAKFRDAFALMYPASVKQ